MRLGKKFGRVAVGGTNGLCAHTWFEGVGWVGGGGLSVAPCDEKKKKYDTP